MLSSRQEYRIGMLLLAALSFGVAILYLFGTASSYTVAAVYFGLGLVVTIRVLFPKNGSRDKWREEESVPRCRRGYD